MQLTKLTNNECAVSCGQQFLAIARLKSPRSLDVMAWCYALISWRYFSDV